MSNTTKRRIKEVFALWMIGEGVIGSLRPRRYMELWRFGPKAYRELIDNLTEHPTATRLLCAAEVGVGVWWGLRQTRRKPTVG